MSECIEVGNVCVACDELWPCRAKLTAQLAAVTAERDALREAGDAMSCELALIASDITPKGPRGQIANHPHEVAALKKVKQIAFAREQWRAALAARGGESATT